MRSASRPALAAGMAVVLAGGLAVMLGAPPVAVLAVAAIAALAGALLAPAAANARPPGAQPEATRAAEHATGETQALLDALPVGVLVIAADGTIRIANRGAAETFGLPDAALSVGVLRAPRLLERIEAARRDGRPDAVDFSLPRGDAHLRAHLRPLGAGVVLVAIEDRTEARRAADMHRDFVANASHELKTPLAAASATIETLLGHARDDPAATERFLGLMAAQVRRMTRLVEDLLSLNRIELNERVAPREPQDLTAIAAEAVEALRPAAEEAGASLVLKDARVPPVRGDRNELGQAVRNLIENAVKYGGEGVEVRVEPLAPPEPGGMAGVAVRDTGPGIAREHLPRLTERFYRVSARHSREKGGTGLGLAIVKHVVARHRGRLEIESTPGQGSCFTIWLPAAEAEPPAGRRAGP